MKKMYKILSLSKQEWLEKRKNSIGGSEVAALLGKSKWLTANDLYNKLVKGQEKKVKTNARMNEGTNAEAHILALFAECFKGQFELIKLPTRNKTYAYRVDKPYLSVSPDGLCKSLATGHKWGIEIKDVELRSNADINAWEGNLLPDQYFAQTLQYKVVINDLEGVILYAHLHYFRRNEENGEWIYDHSRLRPYFIYCEQDKNIKAQVLGIEKVATKFYEFNVLGHHRPKTVISFK